MKKLFLILSLLPIIFIIPACTQIKKHYPHYITIDMGKISPHTTTILHQKTNLPSITIWVHGTFFFSSRILPHFIRCPLGLTHVSYFSCKSYHYHIAQALAKHSQNRLSLEEFYTFGWSGKLSFLARQQAAQELYQALIKLVADYVNKYGQKPYVRIITHSHGGNVALNMAYVHNQYSDLAIDELILLACPVQHETKDLIENPLFKKVISIFSTLDMVQILDLQGAYPKTWRCSKKTGSQVQHKRCPLFSERLFSHCPKLTQVRIVKKRRGLFHIEFMLPHFLQHLPTLLNNFIL